MAEKVDRLTRVNELLKREIANAIERGLITAPGMLVSVTEVNTSVDLRNATVYVSIFGGDNAARRKVMNELGDFRLDTRIEKGDRVFELLNEVENHDKHE